MKIKLSLLGVLSLIWVGSVSAEEENNGPCAREARTFCANVGKGGGRMAQCLREHRSDLSDACRNKIGERREAMKQEMKEVKSACQGDAKEFCRDIPAGKGRLMTCLQSNKDRVSTSCRAELEDSRKMRHKY